MGLGEISLGEMGLGEMGQNRSGTVLAYRNFLAKYSSFYILQIHYTQRVCISILDSKDG